jgi:hypothetical protein
MIHISDVIGNIMDEIWNKREKRKQNEFLVELEKKIDGEFDVAVSQKIDDLNERLGR